MGDWTRRIPFKVDISGIIQIMGSALYSRPDAAVRELVQNSHDAVMRRRQTELGYQGRIDIQQFPDEGIIEFRDDGYGLSADDAEQYLGTLGIGLTGLLKGEHPSSALPKGDQQDLIGMFGIGLFSAFMLAERMIVESRRVDCDEAIRWDAEGGTDIELSSWKREHPGTTVRLVLKPHFRRFAEVDESIENVLKEYTDFLTIPIHLNGSAARVNVIHATWFDPTPEPEAIELELASYFDETPLDVIPVQINRPAISGALYVSPQRTPGFADEAVVTATLRRMVISRRLRGLLPDWASFLRGVLELKECSPTASREDLVRDENFAAAALALESHLFDHLEQIAEQEPARLQAILSWHRYTFAGSALTETRLRSLLRRAYQFPTSQGLLTFDQILERSDANPIFELEADQVVWYNSDRRQEGWINSLFADHEAPCVHALRSFEESLLASMVADSGERAELRFASPGSPGFAAEILHLDDMQDASPEWADFFGDTEAIVRVAAFDENQPVMAFLNERHELMKTFEELKKGGVVPAGFQRLIDRHFEQGEQASNEVLLNRNHRLVARAMEQKTNSPLASVLRLLVVNALRTAGASLPSTALTQQQGDLDWIADCLWGQKS
ncbi:ATP-binding protein [Aporhodopirellula aestuarii]|uniref:ATP-binding protein n=1 Tax=Aporhodopirellula aestuarii TaxID=2950107 RepID=A0ABT0U0P4_9BACT|nr:ATP-binding protein [Aporhodopirellula aestuarii]MCM2370135.1 ATP-binding protein [Aporhodopirellula aestuarii]